ncbi:MAG TPA: inorganic diphosphatase [Steroidobacter sp.]|uniref:inorganic diphosphatase n=1 Tax=Steroidobacter sp. TaxID=1978227 RepID=UPI002ED8444C
MPYASPMDLPAQDPDTGLVRVVIDTPKGSRNKYKFDPELGVFKLSRILPAGLSFPFDFGAIPSTRAEDGDALDVLVLNDTPLFVGCLVQVHLIGVIRARQKEGRKMIRNDRLVGTIETTVNKPAITRLAQVEEQQLRDIEHFFASYNQAQGREFKISGRGGPRDAERMFRDSMREFEKQAKNGVGGSRRRE